MTTPDPQGSEMGLTDGEEGLIVAALLAMQDYMDRHAKANPIYYSTVEARKSAHYAFSTFGEVRASILAGRLAALSPSATKAEPQDSSTPTAERRCVKCGGPFAKSDTPIYERGVGFRHWAKPIAGDCQIEVDPTPAPPDAARPEWLDSSWAGADFVAHSPPYDDWRKYIEAARLYALRLERDLAAARERIGAALKLANARIDREVRNDTGGHPSWVRGVRDGISYVEIAANDMRLRASGEAAQ